MRTILKTFCSAVLVLAYTAVFFSCNNVDFEQDAQTEKCIVRLSVSQNSSRTAMPEELTLANLAYTLTAENDSGLSALSSPWSWNSQSEMQGAELLLDAGSWSFTLTAQKDGEDVLTGTASATITTGTNSIAFTLAPPASGTGSLRMSLTDITGAVSVSATLCTLSGTALTAENMGNSYDAENDGALTQDWGWTEEEPADSETAVFELNHVPKGSYMLVWTLTIGTSTRKLRPVAVVEPGRLSSESYSVNSDNAGAQKFYSVTYNDGVDGEEIEVPLDFALYTVGSTVTVQSAIERANYNFEGWADLDGGSSYSPDGTFTMPARGVTLTAKWQAKDGVKFKVEHYKQCLNASTEEYNESNYELAYTDDNLKGTAGLYTTAASKDYTGFTEGFTVSEDGIADDGIVQQLIFDYGEDEAQCTVIKVYYNRNVHTVTYRGLAEDETLGEGETLTVPESVTARYEATVNINFAPTRTGYEFLKWVKDDTDKTEYSVGSGTYSFTMLDSDVVLTAVWKAKTNTPYTVKHYKQNLDAADVVNPENFTYTLADTDNLQGETASSISVTSKEYEGFTMKAAEEANICANGTTTVKVYYQRNTHSVTYNANFTDSTINVPGDSNIYRYEATVPVLFANTESASMRTIGLRPGYTFLGWSTENTATEATYTSDGLTSFNMEDKDITLYAIWSANTVSGGNITVNPPVYTDVDLGLAYTDTDSSTVTFTVNGGYESYVWFVDGAVAGFTDVTEDEQTGTKAFSWDYSELDADGYNIMLVVTDAENNIHTATTYIVITK